MALKSGTPVNLSALRQDYSALPQIAAVKAQANQQLFNTISEGIEKRKQKKIEADEKASNIRVIERVLNSPLGQRVFGQDRPSAEDVYSSMGKGGQGELVKLLTTMQNAEIAQTEEQRRLEILRMQQQKEQAQILNSAIEAKLLSRGMKETGSLSFDADMFKNTAIEFGVPQDRVEAIGASLMEKRNVIGRQKIDQFSKDDPAFRDYLTALSNLPKDTTEQLNLLEMDDPRSYFPPATIVKGIYNYIVGKKEFDAGLFDLKSVEKYNQILKENPEMLQAAGVPSQIAEFIGLGRLSERNPPDDEITLRNGTTVQKRNTNQPASENKPVPEKTNKEEKGISEKRRKSLEEEYIGTF
jgi:hypothetical protein